MATPKVQTYRFYLLYICFFGVMELTSIASGLPIVIQLAGVPHNPALITQAEIVRGLHRMYIDIPTTAPDSATVAAPG